jgi:hypothetical protein
MHQIERWLLSSSHKCRKRKKERERRLEGKRKREREQVGNICRQRLHQNMSSLYIVYSSKLITATVQYSCRFCTLVFQAEGAPTSYHIIFTSGNPVATDKQAAHAHYLVF